MLESIPKLYFNREDTPRVRKFINRHHLFQIPSQKGHNGTANLITLEESVALAVLLHAVCSCWGGMHTIRKENNNEKQTIHY